MQAYLAHREVEVAAVDFKERICAAGFEIVESLSQCKRVYIGGWGDSVLAEEDGNCRVAHRLFLDGVQSLAMNFEEDRHLAVGITLN
jgi:hypothetical protein